ncbi:MAG: hypothetical protein ACRCXA_02985, partial [Peptostreptococcaceae bacterium]
MKIKLSRVFLIISICFMLAIGIVFGTSYNEKHELIDIAGDRKELDDIAFISQYMYDLYNSKEIIVTDENIKEKSFVKDIDSQLPLTQKIKDNREVLDDVYDENQIYEYGNKFGTVSEYSDYDQDLEKKIIGIKVAEKNLENNTVEKYKMPLKLYNEGDSQIYSRFIPYTYKNQLYVVNIEEVIKHVEEQDSYGEKFKELLIEVYQLDLENEKTHNILTKSLGKYRYYEYGYTSFNFNNKIYTLISEYKDEKYGDVKLLSYNIENNEVEINDIPKLLSQDGDNFINKVFLNGDKAYLVGEFYIDEKNLINLTMGEVNLNSENNEIKVIKRELKTSSVDREKVSSYSCSIDDIKLINDKLYISWNSDIGGSKFSDTKTESYQNLIVADNS